MAAYRRLCITLSALDSHRVLRCRDMLVFFLIAVVLNLRSVMSANLTCYSCNTTRENDVCYSNVSQAPTQVCGFDAPSVTCSVYREDVAGKFTYIVRGCNTSCVQKCGAWGDSIDIDKCSSCCATNLCNVDDAASTPWTVNTRWLQPSIVVAGVLVVWWLKGDVLEGCG